MFILKCFYSNSFKISNDECMNGTKYIFNDVLEQFQWIRIRSLEPKKKKKKEKKTEMKLVLGNVCALALHNLKLKRPIEYKMLYTKRLVNALHSICVLVEE